MLKDDMYNQLCDLAKRVREKLPENKKELVGDDLKYYIIWQALIVGGMAVKAINAKQFADIYLYLRKLEGEQLKKLF